MEKVMFSRTIASLALISLALQTTNVAQAELPKDRWETLKIDNIEIGYGLQIDDSMVRKSNVAEARHST